MKNTQEISLSEYGYGIYKQRDNIIRDVNFEANKECKLETLDGYKLDFTEAPPLPKFEPVKIKRSVGLYNFFKSSVMAFRP